LIVWLSADGVTAIFAAALVKLRSLATARKATMSVMLSFAIVEPASQPHEEYSY
jgi:hypothetical protein